MIVWDEDAGIWIDTGPAPELRRSPKSHTLTKRENARGGRNGTGDAKVRGDSAYYSALRRKGVKVQRGILDPWDK